MSNILAAIGIEQLERFPDFSRKRRNLACYYKRELAGVDGVTLLSHNYDEMIPHIYVVRLPEKIGRQQLQQKLAELGIQTGIHYQPNHQLALYGGGKVSLPIVDAIYPSLLSLPLHPDLLEIDVAYIAKTLQELIEHA